MARRRTGKPHRLTDKYIRTKTKKPGSYGDGYGGCGLFLIVKAAATETDPERVTKSWAQRVTINGRRTNRGIGSYPEVGIETAREMVRKNKESIRKGVFDVFARSIAPRFGEMAEQTIRYESARGKWKPNGRTEHGWRATLNTYVLPRLGNRPIDQITTRELFVLLEPLATSKPETGRKVRQRISAVMTLAIRKGHRTDDPALPLKGMFGRNGETEHLKALPHSKVAEAISAVRTSGAWIGTRLSFEFLVLTACRSGEVRGARWDEIEGDTWTVPGDRTKTGKEHAVPLSARALQVLEQARMLVDGSGLVFPSETGKVPSAVLLSKMLRRLKVDAVPHGFRSSFRDWCGENSKPREVAEACLGHVVGSVTERAYARSDLLNRRRVLLEEWAQYLNGV